MVTFGHCDPKTLNAYSAVPLDHATSTLVQHAIYDGSLARFGSPVVVLHIHSEPQYHGLSHYELRALLDENGMEDSFVIIDDHTTSSTNAVWYVDTTDSSKEDTESSAEAGFPPVIPPGQDYALYQLRMHTADVPIQHSSWDVGSGSLYEAIDSHVPDPYNPLDPQIDPWTLDVDWTDPANANSWWGPAYILADYDEIEISTDIDLRRRFVPLLPVVVRLRERVAREAGLLVEWTPLTRVPEVGERGISMSAKYDAYSEKWPTEYPDDDVAMRGADAAEGEVAAGDCVRMRGGFLRNSRRERLELEGHTAGNSSDVA